MIAKGLPRPCLSLVLRRGCVTGLHRPLVKLPGHVEDSPTMFSKLGTCAHPAHIVASALLETQVRSCLFNVEEARFGLFLHISTPKPGTEVSQCWKLTTHQTRHCLRDGRSCPPRPAAAGRNCAGRRDQNTAQCVHPRSPPRCYGLRCGPPPSAGLSFALAAPRSLGSIRDRR